jgi:hypothetical protein
LPGTKTRVGNQCSAREDAVGAGDFPRHRVVEGGRRKIGSVTGSSSNVPRDGVIHITPLPLFCFYPVSFGRTVMCRCPAVAVLSSNHNHSDTRQITIAIIITSWPSSSQVFFAVCGSDIVNHRGGRFDVFCDFNASKVEAVCSLSRPRPMQPNENRPQYQLHPGPRLDCRGVQHNTNRSTERLRGERRGELGADNAGRTCERYSLASFDRHLPAV